MTCKLKILGLGASLALTACDTGHMPNPLLLPAYGAANVIDNASYNARRRKVASYVTAHHLEILSQIKAGGGPLLAQAYTLARVAPQKRPEVTAQLAKDMEIIRKGSEALTIALMVNGE